ncbi:MAG: prephenate dehydrogenase [Candidatus Latescibacter sp.]|nr:prephenate dehydrogenase [Candidatus Latescibacter sp.]
MFKNMVIVGVGLIGGSFGLAVRRKYPEMRIVGVSSQAAITTALEMGAITEGCGYEELGNAVRNADLVVLCTPIHHIQEILTLLGPLLQGGVLVTDVGSTKRAITCHAMNVLPRGVHFIGGHPMAGSEKRGVGAADPFLLQNAIYVLCPTDNVPGEVIDRFSALVESLGAHVAIMDADTHDHIAAAVSHLPQMIALTLVKMVGRLDTENAPYLRLAAGGFRDMTRIASSPFSVWDDICSTNDDAIREAIDRFIGQLLKVRDRIGTPALGEDFEIANITRATIPKDTKGFLKTLSEILVVVEDKPGVIAKIATQLAISDININDIEVLKVREGEGGTLRLAFEREQEAVEAIDLLEQIGYRARLRK